MKLFLHVSWHAGDTILSRPLVSQIVRKFSAENVRLECLPQYAYLVDDLGVEVVHSKVVNHTDGAPTENCPSDHLFFNLWFGTFWDDIPLFGSTYQLLVNIFNKQMATHGFPENRLVMPKPHPMVDFSEAPPCKLDVHSGWLVENGPCHSRQATDALNNEVIHRLSIDFPSLTFYCSDKPDVVASNVIDASGLNLIELSKLSEKCSGLITKASGVNAATYVEANRHKPRLFYGVNRSHVSIKGGLWDRRGLFVNEYMSLRRALLEFDKTPNVSHGPPHPESS